jgi:thiamine pyrophosphokinase
VSAGCLAAALGLAPEVYAADGGGDVTLPSGHGLRAVIGDMDSLRDAAALDARGVALHPIAEQESTDLEKCLYSIAAPLYLGVGFLGGRVDHELAALNALAKNPEKRLILIGREDLCLLCPAEGLRFEAEEGDRVSFFPMGLTRGTLSTGLRWPVTGLDFAPSARVGTSNSATGGPVEVRFNGAPMLAILPVSYLPRIAIPRP